MGRGQPNCLLERKQKRRTQKLVLPINSPVSATPAATQVRAYLKGRETLLDLDEGAIAFALETILTIF